MKRQQHSKDGKTVTHRDHFRCTITCGYCGKRRHYEDECHIKKRESDKLKRQEVKPVRTPVAILGSLGVCIYVPASRH